MIGPTSGSMSDGDADRLERQHDVGEQDRGVDAELADGHGA
jgi:hypothetical protein